MEMLNTTARKTVPFIMRHRLCMLTAMTLLWATAAQSGEPPVTYTPEQVIKKSIAHHDPSGVWGTARIRLGVHTTYSEEFAAKAGSNEAALVLILSPGHEEFSYTKEAGDNKIEITLLQGQGVLAVNGSTDVSPEEKERLRLREPEFYRDYCEYLYGMPMKLRDSGTIIAPQVNSVRFNDRVVWELRVTYDPEVGKHTWYFYFDHDTFALVGYKFHLDEPKNDGEYITMKGEIVDEDSGLRLPKARAWYYNADDGHLATDDIVSITTLGN